MSGLHGVRDTYFFERSPSVHATAVETRVKQPTAVSLTELPLEVRGEDVKIDVTATAHTLYSNDGAHRRLSEALKDTARRLSEPESFDSLFT